MIALTKQMQEFRLKTIEPVVIKLPRAVKVDDVDFQFEHRNFTIGEGAFIDVKLYNSLKESIGKKVRLHHTGMTKFNLMDQFADTTASYPFLQLKADTDIIVFLSMIDVDKSEFL